MSAYIRERDERWAVARVQIMQLHALDRRCARGDVTVIHKLTNLLNGRFQSLKVQLISQVDAENSSSSLLRYRSLPA